ALLGRYSRFDLEASGQKRLLRRRISDTARLRGASAKTYNRTNDCDNRIPELIFHLFAPSRFVALADRMHCQGMISQAICSFIIESQLSFSVKEYAADRRD